MSSVNKVILVGRLGKDPETRQLQNDTQVSSFSLATSKKYKNKDGQIVENTQWHNIQAWNKLAMICQKYLEKGKLVYIEGELNTRSYDDKDGNKRYVTEIIARDMQILSSKGQSGENNNSNEKYSADNRPSLDPPPADEDLDGLPF
ncbi:MAG: single-stranded DNA-binding protein [Ignavibacteriae bacterium]|nr:single-stranded DNA-binding protein [Ignavibacteriota bacterium]